ncbi:MAG: hypothetical protein A2941_00690 [Candidatus Yanofskybacteria bacterium RIFCSPLOWO2_01_FULL_49_17]|uniref:Uncharacterized protein n=1 Tax=Candidatus Yanofskybacteria bacterium RIFCSPLOWO2_01_FULL_49_17 TaxID=1802700 RepID=A0A1F8GQZ2_9BACT|nr:MAG: hypothetical protein A2941_00690 [Candidatus Yanofskybacteria bacterium RIFCSPLOWO2_01_FULL_49_17]
MFILDDDWPVAVDDNAWLGVIVTSGVGDTAAVGVTNSGVGDTNCAELPAVALSAVIGTVWLAPPVTSTGTGDTKFLALVPGTPEVGGTNFEFVALTSDDVPGATAVTPIKDRSRSKPYEGRLMMKVMMKTAASPPMMVGLLGSMPIFYLFSEPPNSG